MKQLSSMKKMILSVLLLALPLMVMGRGYKQATIYLFGFSASFNDSTVFFTDIQEIQGFVENNRQGFLVGRDSYSYQLRYYIQQNQGIAHPTCVTLWATDRKKIEKKYRKMYNKYVNAGKKKKKHVNVENRFIVKTLPQDRFKYRVVTPEEGSLIIDPHEGERAAREAAEKEQRQKAAAHAAKTQKEATK